MESLVKKKMMESLDVVLWRGMGVTVDHHKLVLKIISNLNDHRQ
jgi:hypothetical protein